VLPRLKRRTREGGSLLPTRYVHGLALGDVDLALRGLVGEAAPWSAASLARRQATWPLDDATWKPRRLDDLAGVDAWADGRYVQAGLEATKAARLVRIGALTPGQTVVCAVESGQRASQASWGAVRRDLRARGLQPWRGTIADGHLGIWAALAAQQPAAAEPRGGNQRMPHGLEAMPNKHPAAARPRLCAMPSAESHALCEALRTPSPKRDGQPAPKAVARWADDWERLVTFSQCPRAHWRHRRTTHVVASPLAAVRRRPTAANRFKKVDFATALLWKRRHVAEGPFRRLHAPELLPGVSAGVPYVDGVKHRSTATAPEVAAWSLFHTYWQDLTA
jgi:putative transposase